MTTAFREDSQFAPRTVALLRGQPRAAARQRIRLVALRVPLGAKLVGANVAIIALLVGAWLIGGGAVTTFAAMMIAAAIAAHLVLMLIALRPIHDLESVASRSWRGGFGARVENSLMADQEVLRIGSMFNVLLDGLVSDRTRMRALATGVIAAGDRERAAIARELHDSTAQRIAALVLELSVAARDTSESEVAERLRDARETSNGTDVDVEVDANRILKRLPRQVETVLYRVAQEADLAEVQRRHRSLGLISMRERVALVDGWIEIKTANGNGTTITASVPVAAAHNALHAVHDALDKEIA